MFSIRASYLKRTGLNVSWHAFCSLRDFLSTCAMGSHSIRFDIDIDGSTFFFSLFYYYPLDWVDKSGRILDLTYYHTLATTSATTVSLSLSIYGVCGNGGMIRLVGWLVGLASRDVNTTICLFSRFFTFYHPIGYLISLIFVLAFLLSCLLSPREGVTSSLYCMCMYR